MKTAISMYNKAFLGLMLLIGCSSSEQDPGTGPQGPDNGAATYTATDAFPRLKFRSPVDLTYAPDGSNRLFVLEQEGIIRVFENKADASSAQVFLDISNKVTDGGERGLLGIAFHPDYRTNGYFFVNYTRSSPLETVIARYKVDPSNPTTADPASETILLTFPQPYSNHNGGAVKFGPDGYLYVSVGDGGSGGDPQNNAQNRNNLLGTILRLDVNATTKGNYGIPDGNPFKGNTQQGREEIYAYGLRNPWRMSFDSQTGALWTGDVGQNSIEEIDIIKAGGNYGWRIKEGNDCFNPSSNCNEQGLVAPIFTYSQRNGDKSITGGYVYRGSNLADLKGKYIYGDFVSGKVWALEFTGEKASDNRLVTNLAGTISAFGVDANNELYILNYGDGKIMKLAAEKE
ncbi:sorbosone dehydrogenase family protein [Telluribacter sp. SYSU D00476]|uniref:PQQ-dependent sugar dehydrogenase n=1 Tax=Telluribacter sp. SYSU D00476 TaxID=2811430 RepID=UPI001FF38B8B|nr:PQQ-dependent sugar dehydrogenase [Telluribacter sp. SYSU D00476]